MPMRRERLAGLADAFLVGERPIARRVEDSVVRSGPSGAVLLRRGRGYAPAAVAGMPGRRGRCSRSAPTSRTPSPSSWTVRRSSSQHIGDLDEYESARAFEETIADLLAMYEVRGERPARGARRPPAVPLHRVCRTARCGGGRGDPAPSRARRVGACRARRLGPAGPRHEPRRHRLRRRRHHLGRRVVRRRVFARASSAWRTCGALRRRGATRPRAIPCRPRRDFSASSTGFPI